MSQISGLTTEPRILHHIAKVALVKGTHYITSLLGDLPDELFSR